MKFRVWPRTIRFQLLAWLVALELLSLLIFGVLLRRRYADEVYQKANIRLTHQATSLAVEVEEALKGNQRDAIRILVAQMADGPSVVTAKVTDGTGQTVFAKTDRSVQDGPAQIEAGNPARLGSTSGSAGAKRSDMDEVELRQISRVKSNTPLFFSAGKDEWECVRPIEVDGTLYGYAWIKSDREWDRREYNAILESTTIFGLIWIGASVVLAWGLARTITKPLAALHRGTQALMESPENHAQFPLPVSGGNEISDLIEAFNRMVASIDEQRTGLGDTLALLNSMLANAPIGLAFFDRRGRFVRVNRVFAEATRVGLSGHLGRTLGEVLTPDVAAPLEAAVQRVFAGEEVRDCEVTFFAESLPTEPGRNGAGAQELRSAHGMAGGNAAAHDRKSPVENGGSRVGRGRATTWIASAYPVRSAPSAEDPSALQVRWVGLIVTDATERKLSEEALRKNEKLAITGKLAASIAHEINNPLEAITNLLYLINKQPKLDETVRGFVDTAEHELLRIGEITQQTLRFYRQSTVAARSNLGELLDSVLSLHRVRLRTLGIEVAREYDSQTDLYCYAGELRQVFANLIGNAIDAMPNGGRLLIRARRSRDWRTPERSGVRFQIVDTGIGMLPEVRQRIFEAFYTTKAATGTGLGLWLSSELIAKHRGVVKVRSHSETLGGASGTIFGLFFPDEPAVAPAKASSQIAAAR